MRLLTPLTGSLIAVALAAASSAALATPTVAADPASWHLQALGYDTLHSQGITGQGVTIAIAESGVRPTSPDLEGADVRYVELPPECHALRDRATGDAVGEGARHAVNVAAQIVGQGGPGRIRGVAPGATLLIYELPDKAGSGTLGGVGPWPEGCDKTRASATWALMDADARGADIVSLSTVGSDPGPQEVAFANLRDLAYVVSAGNEPDAMSLSAGVPGALQVSASTRDGGATTWASRGPHVSLAAPGEDLVGRARDGGLAADLKGTSLSAPIAAGTLALGMQKWPDATAHQLTQALASTATKPGGTDRTDEQGYGVIDPVAFLASDPASAPHQPLRTPPSDGMDGELDAIVRDLLAGATVNEAVLTSPHYALDAGLNPASVHWLPETAEKEGWLGIATQASRWNGVPEGGAVAPATGKAATASDTDTGYIIPILLGVLVVVVLVIATPVVLLVWFFKRRAARAAQVSQGHGPAGATFRR